MEKRREGIRGENNERESRLNETRANRSCPFFFSIIIFSPYFYLKNANTVF